MKESRPNSKSSLLYIFKIVLFLVVLFFGTIYSINYGYASYIIDIFPQKSINPKTITLNCSYAGKDLKVEETAYQNINNYYKNRNLWQKEDDLKHGKFEDFVYFNPKDDLVKKLASDIQSLAKANGLNDDQTVELTTCFIQNIPYDEEKGKAVLGETGNTAETEQMPYQTLFLNRGICTDKTYLGSALLKEMGYGTGILLFENHMALGINVPEGYSSFGNTKYAMMELTNNKFAPGEVPAEISNNGQPNSNINSIKPLTDKDDPSTVNYGLDKKISAPIKIIDINSGKSYSRIVTIKNLENEIKELISSIESKKSNLDRSYDNVLYLEKKQADAYSTYLGVASTPSGEEAYNSYTVAYNAYKNAVVNYNKLVSDYNSTLNVVNKDIETYKNYQYN